MLTLIKNKEENLEREKVKTLLPFIFLRKKSYNLLPKNRIWSQLSGFQPQHFSIYQLVFPTSDTANDLPPVKVPWYVQLTCTFPIISSLGANTQAAGLT